MQKNSLSLTLAVVALITGAMAGHVAEAQRVNTIRKGLKPITTCENSKETCEADTLLPSPCDVVFSGYEKSLRATKETVFVTNNTAKTIERMVVTITYFDTRQRMIHKREQTLTTEIPSGETRCITYPSWDKQFTYYYAKSAPPRVSATPFLVEMTADTLFLDSNR